MSIWYTRIGEKKDPPTIIYEAFTLNGIHFAHVPMEDIVCAFIDAGYTPAEVLQVPEVKLMYQCYHQKRIRKILRKRRAI